MKKFLKCLISILLLCYLIGAVAWSRLQARDVMCSGVAIVVLDSLNSNFVTAHEIARELGDFSNDAPSMKLTDIDTDSIERRLGLIDKIESVQCRIYTDNTVRIDIDPLHPVLRVFDRNKSYYINKDGKRISATARYHTDLPVVSGHFDSTFRAVSLLPLVRYINSDSTWNALVTQIKVDGPNNIILVPVIHGHVINIGDMEHLDSKFDRIRMAYTDILPVKGWNYYDTISVKWGGQIVATRRAKALHHTVSAVD
ncbi:cell division protein FtsQ/DivIB, partial [uncultured Muribaculum sp.]